METRTLKEIQESFLNKPPTPPTEASSNGSLLLKKREKIFRSKAEAQTRREAAKPLVYAKRWRFQYLSKNIEKCVSEPDDSNDLPLQELCKYILKNSEKHELVVCLYNSKSYIWWKQFSFVKQDTLVQVVEGTFFSVQGAARQMGPGYSILYDHNALQKDQKSNFESSSRKRKPRPPAKKNTKKVPEKPEIVEVESEAEDEEDDESESESKSKSESESGSEVQIQASLDLPLPKPKPKLKREEKPKETAQEPAQETVSFAQRIQLRELLSDWLLRLFKEETIDEIKRDIGKKGDPNLAWTFMQNLDLLKKAQFDFNILDNSQELIPRKRRHEDPDEEQYEEEKFNKLLIKEIDEGDNSHKKVLIKKDDEEEEENSHKKVLTKKDEEKHHNQKKFSKEKDKKPKKVFPKKKKKKEKEKEVKPNSEEHHILADSISFYKSAAHFKKTIASLSLFQKELEAFEETLTPKEIKIIEDAIETGFNPIHYIYKYKIGEKTLPNIKGGIYKKCLNSPSIELIYRYISQHLQKKKFEEDDQEDTDEPSIDDDSIYESS